MYALPSNIEITKDVAKAMDHFMSKNNYQKIGVLVDDNTAIHCYPFIESSLPDHFVINIASGEKHKDLNTCSGIWEEMTDHQMDRKSLLINLGGGVIGDMGGFCAATYKRGLNFANIPTTLLSSSYPLLLSRSHCPFLTWRSARLRLFSNDKIIPKTDCRIVCNT